MKSNLIIRTSFYIPDKFTIEDFGVPLMKTGLLEYLGLNKNYLVSLVSRLVSIPTVNPPGENYEEMVGFLEKRCRELNLKTKRFVTPKSVLDRFGIKSGSKRISLVADYLTGSKKTLHINSHYDVVPPTDKWTTDPFRVVIKGNKIYGRGTEDMKGNIACVLFSLKALKECGIKPKVNIQISFTPDEETGGGTGLGYLVQNNLVEADYALSEGYPEDFVSIGNKGVLWVDVTVKGKASHASMPHKGVNSFERMVLLASWLEKLKKKISKRKTGFRMKDAISKSPSFVMGGLLEGGLKVNVVPGMARFSIDRRLIPEEDIGAAKKEIKDVIKRFNKAYKDSTVSVKFTSEGNPSISRTDKRYFKVISDSIKFVIGKNVKFCIMPGATDMRYFMRRGVPSLGYSAKGGERWHSDNEFVYINSLIDTAKVYALIMRDL